MGDLRREPAGLDRVPLSNSTFEALRDLLHTHSGIALASHKLTMVQSRLAKRLRILGITAGKRSPAAPELPTIAEGGVPGFEANQWYGVITSAKVPKDIVNKLSLALNAAVNAPDVAERLMKDGSTPNGTTPAQFQAHIKSEIAKWRELIKVAGIKLN